MKSKLSASIMCANPLEMKKKWIFWRKKDRLFSLRCAGWTFRAKSDAFNGTYQGGQATLSYTIGLTFHGEKSGKHSSVVFVC